MFQDMIGVTEYDVTRTMMKAQIHEHPWNVNETCFDNSNRATGVIQAHQADANGQEIDLVGYRNDPCPCGSGKKFKIVTVVNNLGKK